MCHITTAWIFPSLEHKTTIECIKFLLIELYNGIEGANTCPMSTLDRFRLLFFGSDAFSIRVLNHLLNAQLCPINVITKPGSPLDEFACQKKIVRHKWPDHARNIEPQLYNIGLVASFGSLIDEEIIKKFHHGVFNVHPSLLPRYRGSTPVQAAILDGIRETGCTIMKIPPIAKFDIGDIILQERLHIVRNEYAHQLMDRLADLGAAMATQLLQRYDQCIHNSLQQDERFKTYAKKLRPEQGLLQFRSENLELLDRRIRAYTGFIELFTVCLGGIRLRLEDMQNVEEVEKYDLNQLVAQQLALKGVTSCDGGEIGAGTMFFHRLRRLLCIRCFDEKWLAFRSATPNSKARMTAADFHNGYLSKVEAKFWKTDI